MRIGLIDVDGHNFPNLPLMKISAWHKREGDSVEWYQGLWSDHMNRVYMSKVFSFSPDYNTVIDADEIVTGGGRDMQSTSKTAERFTARNETTTYPMKSNTFTPTTRFIPNTRRTQRSGFLREVVRETAASVTFARKKVEPRERLRTSMSSGKVRRTLFFATRTY